MKPLQSHTKLIQIETRLNKQSYLSRGNLPGPADAKMFLFLEELKRYPDRKSYPNFYHWYILMKQFALNSIQKWINNNEYLEDDQLIAEFISFKKNGKNESDACLLKKNSSTPQAGSDDHGKTTKLQQSTNAAGHQIEYVMDVKIKEGTQCNMRQLISCFLAQQQIQEAEIQQLMEQRRVRIITKMDAHKIQQLKNKISALEGVQTFESKKKDKRFKNVNSSSNFNGDV